MLERAKKERRNGGERERERERERESRKERKKETKKENKKLILDMSVCINCCDIDPKMNLQVRN